MEHNGKKAELLLKLIPLTSPAGFFWNFEMTFLVSWASVRFHQIRPVVQARSGTTQNQSLILYLKPVVLDPWRRGLRTKGGMLEHRNHRSARAEAGRKLLSQLPRANRRVSFSAKESLHRCSLATTVRGRQSRTRGSPPRGPSCTGGTWRRC